MSKQEKKTFYELHDDVDFNELLVHLNPNFRATYM